MLEFPDRPVGVPESYDDHAKLMFDLVALAFQADITRVFVLTLGKEQTNRAYPELGVNAAHHAGRTTSTTRSSSSRGTRSTCTTWA